MIYASVVKLGIHSRLKICSRASGVTVRVRPLAPRNFWKMKLTQEQYAAIGLSTIEFNYLEDLVEGILAYLVNPDPHDIGDFIAREQRTFRQKVDMLKGLYEILAQRFSVPASVLAGAISVLNQASDIAQKRNHLVHSLPIQDPLTKETFLRLTKRQKTSYVRCDAATILSIVEEMRTIRKDLIKASEPIHSVVENHNQDVIEARLKDLMDKMEIEAGMKKHKGKHDTPTRHTKI